MKKTILFSTAAFIVGALLQDKYDIKEKTVKFYNSAKKNLQEKFAECKEKVKENIEELKEEATQKNEEPIENAEK